MASPVEAQRVKSINTYGTPLLIQAVVDQSVPRVKQFLRDLELTASDGSTAFIVAASMQYREITEILVAAKADVNAQNKRHNTALHEVAKSVEKAARASHPMLNYLLSVGVKPGTKNEDLETYLEVEWDSYLSESAHTFVSGGAVVLNVSRSEAEAAADEETALSVEQVRLAMELKPSEEKEAPDTSP